MTKKDYEIIAKALRNSERGYIEYQQDEYTVAVAKVFANVRTTMANLLEENSALDVNGNRRFDYDKFIEAARG